MNTNITAMTGVGTPKMTTPTKAIAANDGWCPVVEETYSGSTATVASDWDSDEVKQIFAQMGNAHESSKQNRHAIVMGAQQEVSRIHDEVTEASRNTQAEMSNLARQASIGGMSSSFGSFGGGGLGYSGYYGATGVNTGIGGVSNNGSMLNNSYLNNANIDDPNYLRTMTDSDLQRMGLDPMMVRMYCNNPSMYPGGLRSMMSTNGTYAGSYLTR